MVTKRTFNDKSAESQNNDLNSTTILEPVSLLERPITT